MSQAFLDKELTPRERYIMKTQASDNYITSCCYDPADLMVRIHEENNLFLEVFMVVQLSTLLGYDAASLESCMFLETE
jgi:hypothetical protein